MAWYPEARINRANVTGGSYVGSTPKIVYHTTESSSFRPGSTYYGHNNWPHFTIEHDGTVWQHISTTVAARALANLPGGVQTNRGGTAVIQIELVAFSADPRLPHKQLVAAKELTDWLRRQHNISEAYLEPGAIPNSARVNAPQRLSFDAWNRFNGLLGHRHVPENHHWDPGSLHLGIFITVPDERQPPELGEDDGMGNAYYPDIVLGHCASPDNPNGPKHWWAIFPKTLTYRYIASQETVDYLLNQARRDDHPHVAAVVSGKVVWDHHPNYQPAWLARMIRLYPNLP